MKPAFLIDLGTAPYDTTWELQKQLVEARKENLIPDTLLFVEHPDVITLGRRQAAQKNILAAGDIPIFEVERGGDVTYHGPGQLVAYPIFYLEESERDLHVYLRKLEDVLIATCEAYGLSAGRNPGWTGAWLGDKKVASIGIAVRRWVTLHGFALNVNTRLGNFAVMNPCGLDAAVMTSLQAATGHEVDMRDVKAHAAANFARVFERAFESRKLAEVVALAFSAADDHSTSHR
jgi:lipoate-protein ligase B